MPAQRKQPVLRGAGQMTIRQKAIAAGSVCECLDRKTGVKGKCLQVGVFIDDTRSDQRLIRSNSHLAAARLGRAQQGGGENVPQAIQLARGTRLRVTQPVVIARLRDVNDADGRLRERRLRRHGAAGRGGPAAILDTIPPAQVTPPSHKRYSRLAPDGL